MPPMGGDEGIDPVSIETELKRSYLDYAMSVIVSRALPDVRDGLKPSQRRILVAMNDLGLTSSGSRQTDCFPRWNSSIIDFMMCISPVVGVVGVICDLCKTMISFGTMEE